MRNKWLLQLALIAAAIGLMALPGYADPAIVVHDGECVVFGVDENGELKAALAGTATGTDYQKVENKNKVLLSCTTGVTNRICLPPRPPLIGHPQ